MNARFPEQIRISDPLRKRLLVVCVVIAFAATWPIMEKTHAQSAPLDPLAITVHRAPHTRSIFSIHFQDPFIAADATALTNGAMAVPSLGNLTLPGFGTATSVPNAQVAATYALQGIMHGNPTLAEFQSTSDVNDTEILQVGDMLGDRTIAQIGEDFVRFTDGSRIGLSDGAIPIPGPPPLGSGAMVPNIPTGAQTGTLGSQVASPTAIPSPFPQTQNPTSFPTPPVTQR